MNKKVAIQGIRGSFHHQAARHVFGNDVLPVECHTFRELIQSVQSGNADYGVMAIENSLAGSIIPNYHMVRNSGLEVAGEVGLRIHMNLMALPGSRITDVEEVQSHQMALLQCEGYFDEHPHLKRVESFDTAGTAKKIADEQIKGVATIAGKLAATEYGLEILAENIEDHDLNYTRFLVLKTTSKPPIFDEISKLSVYFETKHQPGALAHLLSVISGLEINLSKLQSYPIPSKNNRYGFFATLDINDVSQLTYLDTMLQAMTLSYKILGRYKKGETHG